MSRRLGKRLGNGGHEFLIRDKALRVHVRQTAQLACEHGRALAGGNLGLSRRDGGTCAVESFAIAAAPARHLIRWSDGPITRGRGVASRRRRALELPLARPPRDRIIAARTAAHGVAAGGAARLNCALPRRPPLARPVRCHHRCAPRAPTLHLAHVHLSIIAGCATGDTRLLLFALRGALDPSARALPAEGRDQQRRARRKRRGGALSQECLSAVAKRCGGQGSSDAAIHRGQP